MPRKAESVEKPKRAYRKGPLEAKPSREPKTPYDWRKHVKSKEQVVPENTPEYLLAEAAVEKDMMIAELDKWINIFPQALTQLKREAGEIQVDDVMYHLNLISRILKNKFQQKEIIM
jgi:hypothetical protein